MATGAREQARCRARYTRRANEGYVVSAVCATPSIRAVQTASLHKIGDNKFRGTFYNREYGISGTIYVVVRGQHAEREADQRSPAGHRFSSADRPNSPFSALTTR